MEINLNDTEVRVLGCLMEKELATPEYYPLTLNSLNSACNQKSNRDPVMQLEETEVARALDALRFRQLVILSAEGGRAPKYRHILAEKFRLSPAELALLCELMVRGPQTAGELRSRAERMHTFAGPAGVEATLEELLARTPALVARLPRQPGRKEQRYAHLFAGEPGGAADEEARPEAARLKVTVEHERLVKLEEEVALLREEVAGLRRLVEELKAQFE